MSANGSGPKLQAEGSTPALIVDHPFIPRDEWWSLCARCGMSEAAHATTTAGDIEPEALPYRCPDCVHAGRPACEHGRVR